MIRLVQIQHVTGERRVALVEESRLVTLDACHTVYDLALAAMDRGVRLETLALQRRTDRTLSYDAIYAGTSEWTLLVPFDHPSEPARCLVAGTGLTHMASAANRNAMHEQTGPKTVTDSMRMFQWGVEGGKPGKGRVGVQPEWFYKGQGDILKPHGAALPVPSFADDGGEEPEIAGVYMIDRQGNPRRVGLVMANEFSDHVMEKKNYLYLAPSKLRNCAIGPELTVGAAFEDVDGTVSVERNGKTLWSQAIKTGEASMSHSIANLEHHHFKYPAHRRPGDAHIYFFGADAFSFGAGIRLQDGDVMVVAWNGFGRPLRNPIAIASAEDRYVEVGDV